MSVKVHTCHRGTCKRNHICDMPHRVLAVKLCTICALTLLLLHPNMGAGTVALVSYIIYRFRNVVTMKMVWHRSWCIAVCAQLSPLISE